MGLNTPLSEKKPNKQIKKTQQQKNYPFLPSKKTLHT